MLVWWIPPNMLPKEDSMKVDWSQPYDSDKGELGKLIRPIKKLFQGKKSKKKSKSRRASIRQ
jgi:hypothetical protein